MKHSFVFYNTRAATERPDGDMDMSGSWWQLACIYSRRTMRRDFLKPGQDWHPRWSSNVSMHTGMCVLASTHMICMHTHAHDYSRQVSLSLFYIIFMGRVSGAKRESAMLVSLLKGQGLFRGAIHISPFLTSLACWTPLEEPLEMCPGLFHILQMEHGFCVFTRRVTPLVLPSLLQHFFFLSSAFLGP